MRDDQMSDVYRRKKGVLFFVHAALIFLFLVVMSYSFSQPLRNLMMRMTGNSIILISLYCFFFYLFYFLCTFGLKYYEGFVLEHQFGLSKQRFQEWLRQLITKEGVVFCIFLICVQVIYFFLETEIGGWWLPAALFFIIIIVGGELLFRYAAGLFYRNKPLNDPGLKQRLITLAGRADFRIENVYIVPQYGRRPLATLSAVDRWHTLMISNTLLEYAPEEIDVVLGREIARIQYGHFWKTPLARAAGIMAGFFVGSIFFKPATKLFGFEFIFDIDTLPVLIGLFCIVFPVIAVFQNRFWMVIEKETDLFSLELTRSPEAFISLLIRNMQQDASNVRPLYFMEQMFNRRQPLRQRISMAQDFAQKLRFKKTEM